MVVALQIVWLTPAAGFVALAALVPIAAWVLGERRLRRARAALRLRAPHRGTWWAPVALGATLGLVGLAAAQPVLASSAGRGSQRTGQVFVVLDTSTSMLAGRPTRFARAVSAAERLRDALLGTPFGLASMTDRVLPHLFPSIDRDDYLDTLHESIGVDRPPPSRARRQASGFDALSVLGEARFFSNTRGGHVAVLLTDGESRAFDAGRVAKAFTRAHVRAVVVRLWRGDERIAGDAVYRADPASEVDVRLLASQLRAPVFDEQHLGDAIEAVDRALGNGKRLRPPAATATARPLAPYAMVVALAPLGFLLWRRNIR